MRRVWIAPLGILASLVALVLSANGFRHIVDVLQLTDPTGWYGLYFTIGGLAANLAVVFMTAAVLLVRRGAGLRLGIALLAFVPLPLEALTAAPCFSVAHPSALCGVGAVVVADLSIPVVIAAVIAFIATARHRAVKQAGIAVALAFLVSVAAAFAVLAPREAAGCRQFAEVTKRSNCLKAFAERAADASLCRQIEFRTTRFLCLHDIAVAAKQPQLCAEIGDTGPLQPYESPASFYRDTCFQNMAYTLHDRRQCAQVEEPKLRAGCERGVAQEGRD